MKSFTIWPKFSVLIVLTFMVFTIIGTLSHEGGHILVAKCLGYDTKLYYGSMNYFHKGYDEDDLVKEYYKIAETNSEAIINGLPFPEEQRFTTLEASLNAKYPAIDAKHGFLIEMGGPLQTILTSFIGLCILWYRRSKNNTHFKCLDWLGVFLSLFILREVFNTVTALGSLLLFKTTKFSGDEFGISLFLGMNQWVVPIISALVGLAVAYYVIFNIIPEKFRFSFIVSGLIGGLLGFLLWFDFLGPILIP